MFDLALASKKPQLHLLANSCPSAAVTARSSSKSLLFPTSIIGTCSQSKQKREEEREEKREKKREKKRAEIGEHVRTQTVLFPRKTRESEERRRKRRR